MVAAHLASFGGLSVQKTTVDWCRFRTRGDPREVAEAMAPMFGDRASQIRLEQLRRGKDGFTNGALIHLGDLGVGRMDWGGVSQRGWVRVNLWGQGCEWVADWRALGEADLPELQLRRVDVALTTWDGEIDHGRVLGAHANGEFCTSGRPPSLRQIISSDPRAGRTCEIGSRAHSSKFMRCYEKGFEMVSHLRSERIVSEYFPGVSMIDGKPIEGIYRCEVEFKPVGSDIPLSIVETPDQFFVGAYPFCANVLPGVEADILLRRPERRPQLDLKAALENVRVQYGSTLYTALRAFGGDLGAVFERVVGDHHNEALVRAGVLMVEHD